MADGAHEVQPIDKNNIRTGVRTYIVDNKVSDYIDLVSSLNYSKELCDLKILKSNVCMYIY